MGRNPLTPGAVPDPGPVFLPRLLFVLVLAVHGVVAITLPMPAPPNVMERLDDHEVIKQTILEGLGLTRVPDASKMNVSQEEYERMYGVYLRSVEENRRRRQREEEHQRLDGGVTAQRFYSFTHAGHVKDRIRREVESRRHRKSFTWLYFPYEIPELSTSRKVEVDHATLRLFVSGLHPDEAAREGSTVEVRVFQVMQPDEPEEGTDFDEPQVPEERRLLIDQRRIYLANSASKWTEFDVSKAAESWTSGEASNLGLEVECRECVKRGITLVTQETEGSNSSVSPVLNVLVNVHTVVNPRQKRSAVYSSDPLTSMHRSNPVDCQKKGRHCCRHSMEVAFKELEGFGFILQPKKYDAGYCKGRCVNHFGNRHALIQRLVWKNDHKRVPKPCCVAKKFEELEVLHLDALDNTKLKVSKWPNMRVVECHCS